MRQKFLAILFVGAMGALPSAGIADEAENQAKLEALRENIKTLEAELESTKSSRDELQEALEKSEKTQSELQEKANKIVQELNESQTRLDILNTQRTALAVKKKSQQSHVSEHLKSAWHLGRQSNLRLLLNQQEPSVVARNLRYHDYIVSARATKITEYKDTLRQLNAIEPEIRFETSKLKRNHTLLLKRQQALAAAQAERKNILASIVKSIQSQDQQLAKMQADRARLEKILANVKKFLDETELPNNAKNFALLRGKLPWPTVGKVIRNFGTSRVANRLKWEGMLIQAATGKPVIAVHHGRVVFADYLRGHGMLIIVDHGSDYMTLYAHNNVLYKETGEWVNSGERIATVGSTGGRESPALYFELRHKGQPANPKKWFKAA